MTICMRCRVDDKKYSFKEIPDRFYCDCNVHIANKAIEFQLSRKQAEDSFFDELNDFNKFEKFKEKQNLQDEYSFDFEDYSDINDFTPLLETKGNNAYKNSFSKAENLNFKNKENLSYIDTTLVVYKIISLFPLEKSYKIRQKQEDSIKSLILDFHFKQNKKEDQLINNNTPLKIKTNKLKTTVIKERKCDYKSKVTAKVLTI